MIRDILAIVDNAEAAAPFVEQALALGEAQGAHVGFAALTPTPYFAEALLPVGIVYVPEEELAKDDKEKVAAVTALVGQARVATSVMGLHDDIAWLAGDVRRSRRLADMIVIGAQSAWQSPWLRRRVLETSILESGTPTVILPEASRLTKVRHAVLGWKPSPEANRAVHDLVAIAEEAARIDIVVVDQDDRSDAAGELSRHLQRHGLQPDIHRLPTDGMSEADVIQGFAVRARADLVVTGGFGHSRVREVLFGGVTRYLIDDALLPVMLSH